MGVADKLVFFDEFAVSVRPNTSYSWAQKNTRPKIPSIEGNRERLNGLLSVSLLSGKEYLKLSEKAKAYDIAEYMAELAIDTRKEGYRKLIVVLDNSSTHKRKMRTRMEELLERSGYADKIKVEFMDTPPYSPDFNPAEYVIRMLRQKLLHHKPADMGLGEIRERIETNLKQETLITPKQMRAIYHHIGNLL